MVAIIALLISILLPSLREARYRTKHTICMHNLHQIGLASSSYAATHKRGTFPDLQTVGGSSFRVLPGTMEPRSRKVETYGLPAVFEKTRTIPRGSKVWTCPLNELDAEYQQTYIWLINDDITQDPRNYQSVSHNSNVWWVADNYNLRPYPGGRLRTDNNGNMGFFRSPWTYWHRGASSKWHQIKVSGNGIIDWGYGYNMLYFDLSLGFTARSRTPTEN